MSPQNDPPQHDDEATHDALSATEADENPQTHTEVPNRDESDETACAHCGHPIARVYGQWVHTPQRERQKFASWCRTPAIRATAEPGGSDRFFEHIKPGSFRVTQAGMEIAERTIDQTARAAQRVRDAEAELFAAREAEVAIRAIRRGSLDPDEALKMALELIGRRSDVVAVQLPEPTHAGNVSTSWGWVTQWHPTHQVNGETRLITVDDPGRCLNVTQARDLAAALLAAAARAEAADGAQ